MGIEVLKWKNKMGIEVLKWIKSKMEFDPINRNNYHVYLFYESCNPQFSFS